MVNKKVLILVIILLIGLGIIYNTSKPTLKEHRLDELNINVHINEDGSAKIIEKRKAHLVEGTENFIIIENLGESEIKNFVVKENGIIYEYDDDWNVYASQREKTNKNGIVKTPYGYELCWGIGKYGEHNYEIEYTVTDFIRQYEDKQGIFWRFINDQTNIPPRNVSVTIESDNRFVNENSNIWAFGYKGDIHFRDGKIVATNSKAFNDSNYLTILVELKETMFETNSIVDKSFEEVKEKAFEGSDYSLYSPAPSSGLSSFSDKLAKIFFNNILLIIILFRVIISFFNKGKALTRKKVTKSRRYKRQFKGEHCKEFPFKDNPTSVFYILYEMGLSKPEDLMTAFILKWINQGWIEVVNVETGIFFKKEEPALKLIEPALETITLEGKFYSAMETATDDNFILRKKALSKWIKKDYSNYATMKVWETRILEDSLIKLRDKKYITFEEIGSFTSTKIDSQFTHKGMDVENTIHRFINYLYDFSSLNQHRTTNVENLDDLMIWAGLLGMTEVLSKEIKKIYPDYESESIYGKHGIHIVKSLTENAHKAVKNTIPIRGPRGPRPHDRGYHRHWDDFDNFGNGSSGSSGSSGGGGSSSRGGGGGSSGGGSGGGTR
ncbi:MAG TPA: DUF2207 domain-containing protein [Tissierellales bacterium]|nr:DUF2207 domain-containing protein [Tissierellales bacterium]